MAYEGFAKLKGELAHKPGVRNPGAVAASIGRKKYGAKKFQHAASAGTKMRGMSKGR
jgi:hypothetical protein